jgi:hypothetical protein
MFFKNRNIQDLCMYFVSVLFQADLETQRLIWKRKSRTTTDKIKLFIVRTTLNIFVFAVLGGSLYLIYYTNDQMLQVFIMVHNQTASMM